MNPQRASVLDIDTDIEGGRRAQVLEHLREYYGEDRVANVATFRTEKSKSAILTAARGLGIDVDVAQYVASLIPADRGQLRSLDECMNGNEEKGFDPIRQFVIEMTDNYPELWDVASKIEGLVCGSGLHAGGVIFVDEPFTNSTALMRAPDGTVCTQFELHDAEAASLIKMDLLSVEAMDKLHICIDLICDAGYFPREATLRRTYEKMIGIYNLEREAPEMWQMVWDHKINSLFQMDQQSGISGVALTHPKSVSELAVLNSVIRLMASERGAEQPLDMWARYRNNISLWKDEMVAYGLTTDQINWLAANPAITDGICESQEGLMSLVQDERVGGNSLTFADKCRKAIAKKQGKLFEECEQKYFENAEAQNCDMRLAHYIWDVVFKPQRGYSFCRAHTLAYSLIALQEMNLAYRFPIIFWNTACLISDAGGNNDDGTAYGEQPERFDDCSSEFNGQGYSESGDIFSDVEDEENETDDGDSEDGDSDSEDSTSSAIAAEKKKKKVKATNYGRIATAIGRIQSEGVIVAPPDINTSAFTFTPDVTANAVRFGIAGITRISSDLIKEIISNRPYTSMKDFESRVKCNKTQMINLIKSGAFDSFGDRVAIMQSYIDENSDKKNAINLRNLQALINYQLLPADFDFAMKCFNFNKYLKKLKDGDYYRVDENVMRFYGDNFTIDDFVADEDNNFRLAVSKWEKHWKDQQSKLRPWIKSHEKELIAAVNKIAFDEVWNKYATGNISKWEMDSLSCYIHPHELSDIDLDSYGLSDFTKLSARPCVERYIPIKGKQVPFFRLYRIAGTVLDRDKSKKIVSLLTPSGVVTAKIYGNAFANYDRQISERGLDGKKHVIKRSEFKRGNKIIITGIRDEDNFIAKKYSRTPYHLVETIDEITTDGQLIITSRDEN